MEILSLSATSSSFPHTSTPSSPAAGKTPTPLISSTSVSFSAKPNFIPPTPDDSKAPISENPFKTPIRSSRAASHSLSSKLWLSSKLSPPPPPPPPPPTRVMKKSPTPVPKEVPKAELREQGKIFVGNLPTWIKEHELVDFFRRFGRIKSVILCKGRKETERNSGFGLVVYDGPTAGKSAAKAEECDGMEFHGRVITVKLDDGRRLKAKAEDYKPKRHQERDGSSKAFRRVLDTQPENWQAVVDAFDKVKNFQSPFTNSNLELNICLPFSLSPFCISLPEGSLDGWWDIMRDEETCIEHDKLSKACVRGELNPAPMSIQVGRDMEEALSCVRKMKEERVELSLVTYSILVSGFARTGNAEAAHYWFMEAKETQANLNEIIYGSIIYAHCQTYNMDKAEALVRDMEEEGIYAPMDIYHTMMDGYTMIGDEETCLVVFQRLKVNNDNVDFLS
ncbi:Pentatricopeptide repeat-containing protein At5g04810, chloroplastic [Linum grandiflorum]